MIKKTSRTVLSIVLCLCIVMGAVVPFVANLVFAGQVFTVRFEAENATWNGYQVVKNGTVSPYPVVVANAEGGASYASWSDLSAGKLNRDNHLYVAYCIDVPQTGTYQITTANVIRMNANSTPYAAILVNPQYQGKAYKLSYSAVGTAASYCVSEKIEVQLQKGRNMIYLTPLTGDQSVNWADVDYLEISGSHLVTHFGPEAVEVAANAGGYHKFSSASEKALSGADMQSVKGFTAQNVTRKDLSAIPHVSYTVEAPVDGYYDISLKLSSSISDYSKYAVALLVDDRKAEVKPIFGSGSAVADISTYLTAGVHVLTIPTVLPKTDASATAQPTELNGVTFHNGLKLSDQFNSLSRGTVLETETYAFAWRYPTVYENSGSTMVGGSQPGLSKQTYDQLAGGAKLDKNQPMFTYQVEVLEAGEYTLDVSYRDYAQSDYYMIVSVDDTTYAKATYVGSDSNLSNRRIARATLNLSEGHHVIRLVTLPGDSQASWIDVDYMALRGQCPVIGVKDWTHLQSANADAYQGFTKITGSHSAYGQWWDQALAGYQGNSMAETAGVTTDQFTLKDLSNLGWVSYDVHVPKDGFYDMQTYLQANSNSSGTGKVLLVIEKNDVNMINQSQGVIALEYTGESSGWLDLEGEYKAFSVISKNYAQSDYTMALRVTMDNGKSYAFCITGDQNGYGYSRYGSSNVTELESAAAINGNGAKFQVDRISANTLAITLDGKLLDTYIMDGVTAGNRVVSVGFRQYGNPVGSAPSVEVPYEAVPVSKNVVVDLPGIANGTVTTEKESYKLGNTVVLNVNAEKGYSQNITVNGKPILLDWKTGTYSFVAQNSTYDIDGNFEKIRWNSIQYRWVDVRLDQGASKWWLADLSSYLTEGDYTITVSGLMDYSGSSYDWCDMGALTVSGGMTAKTHTQSANVSQYYLQSSGQSIKFELSNLNSDDVVAFYIGSQLLSSKKVDDITYIAYISSQQINEKIVVKINDRALSQTYIPSQATPEAGFEPVSNLVTKLTTPGSLFFRNDNLTNLPDPFVLDNTERDGYYYIYGTWGAFLCYRSRNMMDWEYCGEVLQQYRETNKVWDSTNNAYTYGALGSDLWAPEVVYDPDTGLYYMFFSATPDLDGQAVRGNSKELLLVATATSAAGPFKLVNFKDANSCGAENVHSYNTNTYSAYFAKYLFLDPAQNRAFSEKINNEWRGASNGGYVAGIDPHPYVAPDGTKYLFWVDSYGPDRICAVEMENWLKPKWETAKALLYSNYYTVSDWASNSNTKVPYEYNTTNEGPFVLEHNGKYYLTYSANSYKQSTYLVAQAVSDNVLGPYTKLKESEGGIVLSGYKQGGQMSSGTGHHSILPVGDQLFMVYHRHNDPTEGGTKRNHAIDEIKWITINGKEVMYVNGPNVTLQPKVEKHSTYQNIAESANVSSNISGVNLSYLNDGLLSHQKNGHANVNNVAGETVITETATFTFQFEEAREITSVMVYNSRQESKIFKQIKQIRLICVEDGKTVVKYADNVPFNTEYYTTDSNGKVSYVEPCAAAYAVFDAETVIRVEIVVEIPAGQSSVGISEVMILGK